MKKSKKAIDVNNKSQRWVYSDMVKDHFLNPRYFVGGEEPDWKYNGMGEVGSPACGDVMRIWIEVKARSLKLKAKNHNSKLKTKTEESLKRQSKIIKVGWKTFGCASAIASTSILAEKIVENGGMTLAQARRIKPKDIVNWLGGLPTNKIHCSVLGDQALRKAIDDYEKNH